MTQFYFSLEVSCGYDEELINRFNFICSETELERLKGIANLTPVRPNLTIRGANSSGRVHDDGYYIAGFDFYVKYSDAVKSIANASEITPEELSVLKKFGITVVEDTFKECMFDELLSNRNYQPSNLDETQI